MSNYVITKSGVKVYHNWQDNIVIHQNDPLIVSQSTSVIPGGDAKGLSKLGSHNSEDALTWNIFRSLQDLPVSIWLHTIVQPLPSLSNTEVANLQFWRKYNQTPTFQLPEGKPEVDLTIETESALICIEAKLNSKIGRRRKSKRDQIISTIDVGSWRAQQAKKDFYFCFLTPASPQSDIISHYQDPNTLQDALIHRLDITDFETLANQIFHIHWETIVDLIKNQTFQKQTNKSFDTLLAWLDNRF